MEFPSSNGVVDVSADVSAHFARELHDQVAQPLVGLVLEINELRTQGSLDPSTAASVLHIENEARRVLRQAREMLIDLRGSGDLRLNFAQVLRNELGRGASIVPRVHASSRWPKHISGWAAFNLLRIAQEATANAVRHGRAGKIDIFLDTNAEREAVMVIIDDGRSSPDAPSGFGTVGMSERAVILGGTFSSALRESGGTRVEVRVPVPRLE